MDDRRDGSDDKTGAGLLVSSADADDEDRRAGQSLIIAILLALLMAAAVGITNADGVPDSTFTGSTDLTESMGATGSSAAEGAPSATCGVSAEVAAALSTAETPWDYMRLLGYPKDAIGTVLNQRAESVMDQHANGQVRWDPAANDGIYSRDARLVLIVGEDGRAVEITNTQQVMSLLGMEAVCTAGTAEVMLPAVS